MKILPVAAGFVFAALALANAPALAREANASYPINIHQEYPVFFSNDKETDTLTIDVVGYKPYDVVLLITIRRSSDGYSVFTDSVALKQTTAIHWADFAVDDLARLLPDYYEKSFRKSAELPSWDRLKAEGRFCDSADICPRVDKDDYARVRSSGRSLYCYPAGYEHIKCAWYDDEQGVSRIVTEISW